MKIEQAASIPLILHDPYFGIWSSHDHLYDGDTTHWCKRKQRLRGYITINGATYCFMGDKQFHQIIEQKSIDVSATRTQYLFENEEVLLTVSFTSPLLLDDPILVSRPCTYIDYKVERKKAHIDVSIDFIVYSDLVQFHPAQLIGGNHTTDKYDYAFMGKAKQEPLGHSGDNLTIDWGFVYVASNEQSAALTYDDKNEQIIASIKMKENQENASLIIAYDDLLAINYFGEWTKAYWTKEYSTILDAIEASFNDKSQVISRCLGLDTYIEEEATKQVSREYAFLCNMSYRQSIAAHKLIADKEGNLIFLSKENDSNGCIGTVDVSYPSVPLFLLFGTEYVKGMLRPVFKFAECDVWEYDFAPHDVGRYPYATGQVYGLNDEHQGKEFIPDNEMVFPFYYMFPRGSKIYDLRHQMPVEECGNMLILTAAICQMDKDPCFMEPHYQILEQWANYLLEFGMDPGEQLCTDDFAGHLSHNVNLSAKAIMGVEAFAILSKLKGDEEKYSSYHQKAIEMAKEWEQRADVGDHTMLTFESPDSWSLKYNLVWDNFFGSHLFAEKTYEKEIDYYLSKMNTYGVPLDSRKSYTKSDWILWCAAMSGDKEKQAALVSPVASFVKDTASRIPFSDWYDTVSGESMHFIARSVQGGIFMPMLMGKRKDKSEGSNILN